MSDWISVDERLPDEGDRVMASDGRGVGKFQYGGVILGAEIGGWWHLSHIRGPLFSGVSVTHWQPLPEPPEVAR